ncbi:MAG: hypothetical protein QXK37_02020 [Candidatus Woesearchaeota archaeon]
MREVMFLFMLLNLFASSSTIAYSYVDPGTGGMVIKSIWMYILGLFGFVIGLFFMPIKKGVVYLWKKIKGKGD